MPWSMEAGQHHVRQLPFRHRLQLLSAAASSGSEVNLEVALALLQPTIFPEIMQDPDDRCIWHAFRSDPAVTAIEAGKPQLLDWLLRRCPALVHPPRVLEAAARRCNLARLQAVWEQLQASSFSSCTQRSRRPAIEGGVLGAAAESATPDAVAKMEWVLAESGGRCNLDASTAAAAARSGDLGRLRWLHDRGCPMAEQRGWLLPAVLSHADMSAVEWLVDEAGCSPLVPPEGQLEGVYWAELVRAAACSTDGVNRVLWLQQRGVPIQQAFRFLLNSFHTTPATAGKIQVLRFLQRTYGMGAEPGFPSDQALTAAAAGSGSVPLVEELLQAGMEFDSMAYLRAGGRGDVAMTRWLGCEAGVPADELSLRDLIEEWPVEAAANSRGLREVVQLLVDEAGCTSDWDSLNAGRVLCAAAARGDLALLQYLLLHHQQQQQQQQPWMQRGCVPDWEVFFAAATAGCEALLEWLAGQHPGCLDRQGLSYDPALCQGDKCTLSVLRRLGVPWGAGDVVAQATQVGRPVPVLRWLVEQGAPMGREADAQEGMEENGAGVALPAGQWPGM